LRSALLSPAPGVDVIADALCVLYLRGIVVRGTLAIMRERLLVLSSPDAMRHYPAVPASARMGQELFLMTVANVMSLSLGQGGD
jgi:hypothetical protein